MTYPLNSRLRRRRRATKVPQQRKEPVLLSSGSPRWSFSSCSASPNSCHSIYFQYDGLFKAMTNSTSLCQYFVFKDLNELELPKTCKTEFPDVDDLLNFKLIIYPDEVNIAKGTTDPRVEFILPKSYCKFKHKSWSNFIFRISTKH